MTTEIIPLGTASAVPTRERHLSGTALRREGRLLLFDCGEGTQFQLLRAGLKRSHLDAIFITHLHGDHYFGLMGLLSTLALLNRIEPLTLVGPAGIAEIVQAMPGVRQDDLPFHLAYVELWDDLRHEVVFETKAFTVEARPLDHRVFTVGYRFQGKTQPGNLDVEQAQALGVTEYRHYRALKAGEDVTLDDGRRVPPEAVVGPPRPGGSFAYVTDTRPCEAAVTLARDADLLYHEATFGEDLPERAAETGHSTAHQAAEIARRAGAKKLILGHFSARYKDVSVLVEEARDVFQNTEAAEELKRYKIFPAGP
ncbi:MAG: ribonuclease Z [Bacteroidetes bacterium]|nr:ribonuclease Z [Bacteroidota bacterium]